MDTSVIPPGLYCYTYEGNNAVVCPYWSIDTKQQTQANGYCAFLKLGDWMEDGTDLLWDQCKECGINDSVNLQDFLED